LCHHGNHKNTRAKGGDLSGILKFVKFVVFCLLLNVPGAELFAQVDASKTVTPANQKETAVTHSPSVSSLHEQFLLPQEQHRGKIVTRTIGCNRCSDQRPPKNEYSRKEGK
jgi:hypothetical protein